MYDVCIYNNDRFKFKKNIGFVISAQCIEKPINRKWRVQILPRVNVLLFQKRIFQKPERQFPKTHFVMLTFRFRFTGHSFLRL